MNSTEITRDQLTTLKDIPGLSENSGDDAEGTNATISSLNTKRVVIIEHKGQMNGPCEFIASGQRRIPRLHYVRVSACAMVDSTTVQVIHFDANVMGDIAPCTNSVTGALDSIDWRKLRCFSNETAAATNARE